MRRTIVATLATVLMASWVTSASAVIFDSTVHYLRAGRQRNVDWPWPYFCPDRVAVREPFEIMIRNGWRRQNLLGPHHFDPATHQLNTAGQLQVRWIMTQAPPMHRQLFVERAIEPAITADRIAAARQYASRVAIDGQQPEIFETYLMAEGRPAAMVDMTNVRFMENMPIPVLPTNTSVEE